MKWSETEVLITGGTGSLGKTLTRLLLSKYRPKGIRIFSRDELKQWEMRQEIKTWYKEEFLADREVLDSDIPISYLVGDVRDRKRLELATKGVDLIIHAAALKQIVSCEENPLEAIQTNVNGAQNILYAALENKVKKVMAISSDKAVYPINLYGATKLCAEKLFIQGNIYSGDRSPRFSCCRYGNVIGSRGSVIPLFRKQYRENGKVTVTDPKMTRFWTTLKQMSNFILQSIEEMKGGEIFVPKMGSANIVTVLEAAVPEHCVVEYCGIRPGEKLHETLITMEESLKLEELSDRYKITEKDVRPAKAFEYRSDNNTRWLNCRQIRKMIEEK